MQPPHDIPIAYGEDFSEADFAEFQQYVQRKTHVHLKDYKSGQMRRRIALLAKQAACESFMAYAAAIEHDPAQMAEFRGHMTINVTEMLRNPNRFEELVSSVLPDLLARRSGLPLSIWSAGCSYGAEAYTLALLLHEISPTTPHRILGTDIDLSVLTRAERPCFSPADMINLSPERRAAHFHAVDGAFYPGAHLCGKVQFSLHDLLRDPYPRSEYDLILCRNVVIYFTDDARKRVYHGFYQALRPGGVLFVGGTERLPDHRAIGFDLIRPFFYRKPSD